ncbi:uncharacterized protein LOC116193184 [Punica granatum]|uniref:Uncharacterized protein n=2 Tax=Punica granatum TaxID=22663 RepID=A0A218XLV9_PUNGR|nr:uncharacterized protein LOC116193184 [Punica granatum]OWM85451.1 hypothetical protein CDL15_Pgr019075 [Punica granatum]PKI42050.1 hypothetical protein CRG98_037503 [Punica granatum]
MRAHLLPLSAPVFTRPLLPNPKLPYLRLHRSIKSQVAAAKSHWGSDYDDFDLEDDDFGNANQRVWWSDYGDDELGFDEDGEFWVFKIFRAFGWMLPAIAISLLLGTGPNAFIMALAVPLGQKVISVTFDKVWGWTVGSPRPSSRPKTRKKPFSRATNETRTSAGKQEKGPRGSYQSWVPGDGLNGRGDSKGQRFGGWDDLDGKTRANDFVRTSRRQEEGSREKPKSGKLSRVGRVRERPLLLRLLVAAFPFLGSWMRILF